MKGEKIKKKKKKARMSQKGPLCLPSRLSHFEEDNGRRLDRTKNTQSATAPDFVSRYTTLNNF